MSLTPSTMMPLGTKAPDFNLPDVISKTDKTLEDVKGEEGLVVMFICAHCPFVKNIEEELGIVARHYQHLGIGFVAISSNDVENYPEDSPDELKKQAETHDFSFPYLYDESQETAKAYDAACTPDFFLFDKDMKCTYRGRFDASTPGNNEPVDGGDLSAAIDAQLDGEPPLEEQLPSMGCNIKWKV
ncbi:MAG: thioredoxin family protein [Cyclobacteriaceae bacterium]